MVAQELIQLCSGLPLNPLPVKRQTREDSVPHAPILTPNLTKSEFKLAVRNALRYFPESLHSVLAAEFAEELRSYGHIYMYRFIPDIEMKAYPLDEYPVKCRQAAAIMIMIMNNLDHRVAQFPHELVTYGGNGQVLSNWAQFWIMMSYLSRMTESQTLAMYSGHPAGLFPSRPSAPRLVITNGMMVPNYSSREEYDKRFAMGVTMYGQMTAGSYCYIGPQGIVHGTTLTVLNAGRRHLGSGDLTGRVFVSSGLGGMSGAQAKAATISGCIGVIAEVSEEALDKRCKQGWVKQKVTSIDECIQMIRDARRNKTATSIGYLGNVVLLWEKLAELAEQGEVLVDIGSDQTSCHNPYLGGYYPYQLSYQESRRMMHEDPTQFKQLVQASLLKQVKCISTLTDLGVYFFDYGNAFLLEASRAGADVYASPDANVNEFKYPSYVQHIMGDIFSLGFGPFRWVCTSCDPEDLAATDLIATEILQSLSANPNVSEKRSQQYEDNIKWIKEAGANQMVVGSQARILYSDQKGRIAIAVAFNKAIASGRIKGSVVLSRDHHDVSGTDSPFRETSNVYDGSAFCADMAVQNCIGDSFRGATWVAIHNGGGVGWGEVINGGFGLVLDGSEDAEERAKCMLQWDVSNGLSRRCWAGNSNAYSTVEEAMKENDLLTVTMPSNVREEVLSEVILTHPES